MSQIHSTSVIEFNLPVALYLAFQTFLFFVSFSLSHVFRFRWGRETEAVVLFGPTPVILWLVFRRSEAQLMQTVSNLIALNDSLTHSLEREALGPNPAQETCFPASSICLATLLSQSPQHTIQRSPFSPLKTHEVHIKCQPFLFLDCCHLNTSVLT